MVSERDCLKVRAVMRDPRAPAALRALFTPRNQVSARATRASDRHLQIPRCRLESTKHAFLYRSIAEWNALPPSASEREPHTALRKFLTHCHRHPGHTQARASAPICTGLAATRNAAANSMLRWDSPLKNIPADPSLPLHERPTDPPLGETGEAVERCHLPM